MKEMLKRAAALLIMASLVLGLAACSGNEPAANNPGDPTSSALVPGATGGNSGSDEKTDTDTVVTDIVKMCGSSDPGNLSPWNGSSGSRGTYLPMFYQSLITRTSSGEPEFCLAKSYEKIDDLTYQVTLYDYIYDTEHNPLTASDVVFSYEKAAQIGKATGISTIESVTALNAYTVEFKYTSLGIGDLYDSWSLFIVTQAAYEASSDEMAVDPVGTTQYRLKEYITDYICSAEKTHDYWQTDASLIDTMSQANAEVIEWYVISDAEQRAVALKTGTVDQANINYTSVQQMDSVNGISTAAAGGTETIMLFCNMSENSVLSSNVALRKAIFYALNNEALAAGNTNGPYAAVYDLLNPYYGDYYEADYEAEDNYYDYNVDKAKELLAEAGYSEGELTLNLICRNRQDFTDEATMIQAYLEQIGISLKINTYEISLLSEYASDPALWDLYLFANGSSNSYGVGLYTKMFDAANYTWGGTINFAVDPTLQEKLAACANLDTYSEETMRAFHDYVIEQAYAMGLMQDTKYYGVSDRVISIVNNLSGQSAPWAFTFAY